MLNSEFALTGEIILRTGGVKMDSAEEEEEEDDNEEEEKDDDEDEEEEEEISTW